MDTIFALASARGRAGIGVVRISGPKAVGALASFGVYRPNWRHAGIRELTIEGERIDRALVLAFARDASFTGEEVVELHLHGSPAIIGKVLSHLADQDGLRLAEPGEFTRQALLNDRLDLAQVEGLGALIDAETEAQRVQAQRVLDGELAHVVERWRVALIRAATLLETAIDFVDEEIPADVVPEVLTLIGRVQRELTSEIAGSRTAERIREGFEVAIVGAPNAGKSTLLNALAGRDAAIVSKRAGTTRDVIEVRMDIEGLPVTFLDTAGLRETDEEVEAIGIARAMDRAKNADLRVFLMSDRELPPHLVELRDDDIKIWGKSDLGEVPGLGVSGLTGDGVEGLAGMVSDRLGLRALEVGVATHARHRVGMRTAAEALTQAEREISKGEISLEVGAEEVRRALRCLEVLVGRVDVEDLLDEIFASFCLGK